MAGLTSRSYGVEDAEYAISQLAQTTMRSEIGQLSLDHVLKERANLNANITAAINEAAQDWGVTCLRYEIRDIHAPELVVDVRDGGLGAGPGLGEGPGRRALHVDEADDDRRAAQ